VFENQQLKPLKVKVELNFIILILLFFNFTPNQNKHMKKLLLAAALALGCYGANAQSWGIKGGVNFANLTGDGDGNLNVLTSFHAGLLYEIHVVDIFSIQPELLYSVQGAKIKGGSDNEIKLNYFSVPVVAKLYLTDGFNIQAGPQFGMLLSESDNFKSYNSNTFDFGVAAGLEFFITDGLFAQARYYAGTQEVAQNADLKNTTVQVSLGFIF